MRQNRILPYTQPDQRCVLISATKIPSHDGQQDFVLDIFFNITGLRQSPLCTLQNLVDYHSQNILVGFKLMKHRYYIGTDSVVIPLTNIQASCLVYLSIGKTCKQIANLLECAPRTIEDHVNILKRKLGVYSMVELIDCFWRNPIRWF